MKGIRVENGWGAPTHYKIIFGISVLMFCIGTWMLKRTLPNLKWHRPFINSSNILV